MSFEKPPASYPFMEYWVMKKAPTASGIYVLFSTPGFTWEVIYVGASDNIQQSLLGHIEGDIPCIVERQPTSFLFELADPGNRLIRRDSVIGDYGSTCNGPD